MACTDAQGCGAEGNQVRQVLLLSIRSDLVPSGFGTTQGGSQTWPIWHSGCTSDISDGGGPQAIADMGLPKTLLWTLNDILIG